MVRTTNIAVLLASLLLSVSVFAGGNQTNDSFAKAKSTLQKIIYRDHQKTFYCGCTYDEHKKIDLSTCGYKPIGDTKRAERVEWDHVVPAEAFGQSFPEWRDGNPECVDSKGKSFKGRKCAQKVNSSFRLMQADMHNLVPAVGELNGLRKNYSMAVIPDGSWEFGECKVKIKNRKFEPPKEVRGDIARIYFYMDRTYPGRGVISDKNRKLFEAWNKEDSVDAWECERERRIRQAQGNSNSVVEEACK